MTMEGREGSEREGRGHEGKERGERGQVEKKGGLEGRKGPCGEGRGYMEMKGGGDPGCKGKAQGGHEGARGMEWAKKGRRRFHFVCGG